MSNIPKLDGGSRELMIREINIPRTYVNSCKSQLPEVIKPIVEKYLINLEDFISRGIGFIFSGVPGVGKTSAAVYIAKYARVFLREKDSKFNTVYFSRSFDIRESFKNKTRYDDNELVYDHCRSVDLLVIDNLTAADSHQLWPGLSGPRFFTELIIPRSSEGKSTIITTNLSKAEMYRNFQELCDSIGGFLHFVDIKGEDQRVKKTKDLAAEFNTKVASV